MVSGDEEPRDGDKKVVDESDDSVSSLQVFIYENRISVTLLLIGLIIAGMGVFYFRNVFSPQNGGVEILETTSESLSGEFIVVEVAGAVAVPGVYELDNGSRTDDAIKKAGGLSADADEGWMEITINRAAKLVDGQKVYIKSVDEQSDTLSASASGGDQSASSTFPIGGGGTVNINTSSANNLESLWGIGPVTAQNIIEQRPYSSVQELMDKKILKANVYERNKDLLTIY